MNWKRDMQLNDLDDNQRLEFTCKTCGAFFFKQAAQLKQRKDLEFAWLDEVEREHICLQRGCYGQVRLSLYHNSEASGFVAGLA
jgi:transcription elongation factor Elf1